MLERVIVEMPRHVAPSRTGSRRSYAQALPLSLLAVAVAVLFFTSPYRSDIWWSDATRHAMDGVFYRDMLKDLPFTHLKQYAMDYYLQYPALTTLFYPPLFPLAEAGLFAAFGVSQFTAMLTVALFYLATVWGIYFLVRRWLSPTAAFAVALLFSGAPEVAYWGRQIMLEIPTYAFLVWSVHLLMRYLETGRSRFLYSLAVVFAAGLYTKQTILFMAPVFVWGVWSKRSSGLVRVRDLIGSLAVFAVVMLPLAVLTWKFGRFNAGSVTGGDWAPFPLKSIHNWTYYFGQLPGQLGWPTAVLGIAYLVVSFVRKDWRGPLYGLLLGWFLVGYLFFSAIGLKSSRFTVFILLPMVIFAVEAINRTLPARFKSVAVLVLAVGTFAHTIIRAEVPHVSGYQEAVNYVARVAPRQSVILFSGYRDGPFIFDLRAREDRRDLSVLRSDKLLLRVAERRERGLEELNLNEAQIGEMLNRYSVAYVVNQPNFWDDLTSMQKLQHVLHTSQFKLVATIPVTSNVAIQERELEIYQNLGPLNPNREKIKLEVPLAGMVVEGDVGGKPSH